MVECFVCSPAGHNRPAHEVMFSRDVDMSSAFENEFWGTGRNPITLAGLQQVRRKLNGIARCADSEPTMVPAALSRVNPTGS